MRYIIKILLICLLILPLAGFMKTKDDGSNSTQPPEERQAQEALPKSSDPLWTVLSKCHVKVDEKKGLYHATFTPEIKAMVGQKVTISGFLLPLEATETAHHYILSKRTPTCPFCPPGEPNEIIDLWTEKPVKWDDTMFKFTGTFELIDNEDMGMFFAMKHANQVK